MFLSKYSLKYFLKMLPSHGFIWAILMSVRCHKKLSFLIKWLNLREKKIEVAFKINYLTRFLLFSDTCLSSRSKKAEFFQGLYSLNPHQGSTMNLLQSLNLFETPTCIFEHSNLCSKMDINETAWMNACIYISHNMTGDVMFMI